MSRTGFPLAPQFRQLGQELFQALSLWAAAQVTRAQRRQSGLTLADLMQQVYRIKRGESRPKGFLGHF